MLEFKDPNKELPEMYKTVFVKQKDNQYCFAYYSPMGRWYPDDNADVAFSIDVIGWMPIEELDTIPVMK